MSFEDGWVAGGSSEERRDATDKDSGLPKLSPCPGEPAFPEALVMKDISEAGGSWVNHRIGGSSVVGSAMTATSGGGGRQGRRLKELTGAALGHQQACSEASKSLQVACGSPTDHAFVQPGLKRRRHRRVHEGFRAHGFVGGTSPISSEAFPQINAF